MHTRRRCCCGGGTAACDCVIPDTIYITDSFTGETTALVRSGSTWAGTQVLDWPEYSTCGAQSGLNVTYTFASCYFSISWSVDEDGCPNNAGEYGDYYTAALFPDSCSPLDISDSISYADIAALFYFAGIFYGAYATSGTIAWTITS